jgi:hypothetical protein
MDQNILRKNPTSKFIPECRSFKFISVETAISIKKICNAD